jgi:hypothetical protein
MQQFGFAYQKETLCIEGVVEVTQRTSLRFAIEIEQSAAVGERSVLVIWSHLFWELAAPL